MTLRLRREVFSGVGVKSPAKGMEWSSGKFNILSQISASRTDIWLDKSRNSKTVGANAVLTTLMVLLTCVAYCNNMTYYTLYMLNKAARSQWTGRTRGGGATNCPL